MYLGSDKIKSFDYSNVNPLSPSSVINFLKKIDKPFYEDEYKRAFRRLEMESNPSLISIVKYYLSIMDLKAYREFTFKDGITEIEPNKFYGITAEEYFVREGVFNMIVK